MCIACQIKRNYFDWSVPSNSLLLPIGLVEELPKSPWLGRADRVAGRDVLDARKQNETEKELIKKMLFH